jgi:hypothetical protein
MSLESLLLRRGHRQGFCGLLAVTTVSAAASTFLLLRLALSVLGQIARGVPSAPLAGPLRLHVYCVFEEVV